MLETRPCRSTRRAEPNTFRWLMRASTPSRSPAAYPSSEIPLPWRAFFDRDERGHDCGLVVDVVCADLDRLEQAERADPLLGLLDRAAPEQIARRVRQPPADDAIVHTPVAGDVDRAEEPERARFGAQNHTRPRSRRSARARCRPARTDSRGSEGSRRHARPQPSPASSVSAIPARSGKSSRRSSRTSSGKHIEALEPDFFDDDGISGSDFGWRMPAGGGEKEQGQ